MFPDEATVADDLSHHYPIFLLHEALVSFLIRASSREGDLLTYTIGGDLFVDKFSAVVGVESQDGKRKERPGTLEGSQDRFSPTVEQGQTLRPLGGDIGQRDRVEVAALRVPSTMGNQINLQEAWFGLVPLGERADRNLLFEQRTRLSGRKAVGVGVAIRLQEAICGGRAHREKVAPVFLVEMHMPFLLQRF
jgi:hypothetical protein